MTLEVINENRAKLGLSELTGRKNAEILDTIASSYTCVATLKQWNKLGRKIIKGEHSLKLYGAKFKKDEKTGKQELSGYYVFSVFDISQTEIKKQNNKN